MIRRDFFGSLVVAGLVPHWRVPSAVDVDGIFDVTASGAKGDGRTDDTDAIQQAISAAHRRRGGGVVFFPAGNYQVRRTLAITTGGVRFMGVGSALSRIQCAVDLDVAVSVGSAMAPVYGWGLEGIRVEGQGHSIGQGVLLRGAREGAIRDVWVVGAGSTAGVTLDGRDHGGCWSNRFTELWVSRSPGVNLEVKGEVNATRFGEGGFSNGGSGNVVIRGGKALWFEGCQFEGTRQGPELLVLPDPGQRVVGLTIASSWFEVRSGDPAARGMIIGPSAADTLIRGITIRDSFLGGNETADVAIECRSADAEVWSAQNTFTGFRRGGLFAMGAGGAIHADGFPASPRYAAASSLPLIVRN